MKIMNTFPVKMAIRPVACLILFGDNYTFLHPAFLRISQRLFPANFPDFTAVSVCECVAVCTFHARR